MKTSAQGESGSGHDGPHRISSIGLLWVACVIGLLVVWAGLVVTAVDIHSGSRKQARALTAATAKGFSEYVGLHFGAVDRLLITLGKNYLQSGNLPQHSELTAQFAEMAPILLQVAIAAEDGAVVRSSLPLNPGVTIKDRPHFRVFQDDPTDRLHVSQPVVGRVSGKMSIQVVRPLLGARGEFKGVIVASIDPVQLQQYFGSLSGFYEGGVISIVGRNDGVTIARFAGDQITWGQSVKDAPVWQLAARSKQGVIESEDAPDGKSRVSSFHQVTHYPFLVEVSSVVNVWNTLDDPRFIFAAAIGFIFSVTVVYLSYVLARRARDQRTLIEQLQLSQLREQEASRMKSSFLASVSHELRTPLNSILGFSELIRERKVDAETSRFAELIHESGHHLHSLVNTLLDLAKIEAGRMDVQRDEVSLGRVLSTLVEVHRVTARKKGLDMSMALDVPQGAEVLAQTDRTKLVQVLNNVLHNAVKFTTEGSVRVTAWLEGQDFHVRVADTGPGIRADQIDRVFERFHRSNEALDNEGTGLGLALSRELMGLLGGTIELQSQVGRGTQVDVRLPGAALVQQGS